MKMWTAQRKEVFEKDICGNPKYFAGWDHVQEEAKSIAYRWMVARMRQRGIPMRPEHAPIWAWKSMPCPCELQGYLPVSERNARREYVLAEIEPTHSLFLMSSYSSFSEMLIDIEEGAGLARYEERAFRLQSDADTQIALPWLSCHEIERVWHFTLIPPHGGEPELKPYG